MLIVAAGTTGPYHVELNTVEIFPDLSFPANSWVSVSTANFPANFLPSPLTGSRGVTLNNVFYVLGRGGKHLKK